MSERQRYHRKKRGEPRVVFIHEVGSVHVLVDAFDQFEYHSEKKMVGFNKAWHDPEILASQFRLPSIDDGILLRAKNWAHVTPHEATRMWERGLRVTASDLVALAITLDIWGTG
jgi:hypothetical protein